MKHLSLIILILIAFALFAAGLMFGSNFIAPSEFILSDGSFDPVFKFRLIRSCAALTLGASLALSGMIFQVVLRNPLAEPFTLGISGGAGVGAALAIVLGLRAISVYAVPFSALIGALTVLTIVVCVSRGGAKGDASLLLSGVIAGTVASSILMYIISIADWGELAGISWWMLGDLQGADISLLLPAAIWLAISLLLLRFFGGDMNALALGRESAWAFGVNPKKLTVILVVTASLLAAGTVAVAGIIGFCGLIIPHMVRRVFGCDHRKIIFHTALVGAIFLVLCDIVSRGVFTEREIPIGVITSLIGGPLFLWMLNSGRGK